jgi:hypothetical protein
MDGLPLDVRRNGVDTSAIRSPTPETRQAGAPHEPGRGGEIRTPGLLLPNLKTGISGCAGLYRNLSKRSVLAGVMPAQSDTARTGQHSPVLPELIHL